MYIYIAIYKPHGNEKPKIYNRYAHKIERGIQTLNKDCHQTTRKETKAEEMNKNEL